MVIKSSIRRNFHSAPKVAALRFSSPFLTRRRPSSNLAARHRLDLFQGTLFFWASISPPEFSSSSGQILGGLTSCRPPRGKTRTSRERKKMFHRNRNGTRPGRGLSECQKQNGRKSRLSFTTLRPFRETIRSKLERALMNDRTSIINHSRCGSLSLSESARFTQYVYLRASQK